MIPLTNKKRDSYVNQKTATSAKKNLKKLMIKIVIEVEMNVIMQVNI